MVDRYHVSGAQVKALYRLAKFTGPENGRVLMIHPFILEGLYRRNMAGKIPDPGGVVQMQTDVRWHITPKGRLFLETREYIYEEEIYLERQKEVAFGR